MVLADAQTRYYKLKYPQTNSVNKLHIGTDEHGQKISEAASKNKTTPKSLVDNLNLEFNTLDADIHSPVYWHLSANKLCLDKELLPISKNLQY